MVHNKSTQAAGTSQTDIIVIRKKKRKLSIPKNLNIFTCWNIIGPKLAKQLGEGYTHIPYYLEADAYKIGHIFVIVDTQVKCFRITEVVKVIGPMSNFTIKKKTNPKFANPNANIIKRQPDAPNFQMILVNRKQELIFTGYNCLYIDSSLDTIVGNVTIDRSSHADLVEAKWFGMITGVFAVKNSELKAVRRQSLRTTYIGEDMQTVLFKYVICEMNSDGLVTKTSKEKLDVKWASIIESPRDSLPLIKLSMVPKR